MIKAPAQHWEPLISSMLNVTDIVLHKGSYFASELKLLQLPFFRRCEGYSLRAHFSVPFWVPSNEYAGC